MIVNRAYRFRLYPNREQEQALSRQFGSSRFVYNNFLRARVDYYLTHKDSDGKKGLNYHDTARMLTELKRQAEYKWLSEANTQALQLWGWTHAGSYQSVLHCEKGLRLTHHYLVFESVATSSTETFTCDDQHVGLVRQPARHGRGYMPDNF